MKIEAFTHGNTYHIYNRGINGCKIFTKEANYNYFLELFVKYLEPVSETYAWALMPNHFHFLLRLKETTEVQRCFFTKGDVLQNHKNQSNVGTPSQQLSKLFNAYAQAFNRWNCRHGSLFERPFKRKKVNDEKYLKEAMVYIHNNPVYHGLCKDATEYKWSSFNSYLSDQPSRLYSEKVKEWFSDNENFLQIHKQKIAVKNIEKSLGI